MARRHREHPPLPADLEAYNGERIGEAMPKGVVPPDTELHWLDQLLFGSAAAMEHCYRVQPDVENFLSEAPEGHFAYGFWGHGIQSHAFYIQRVEPWCRIYLRLPSGGVYSDHEAQARRLHKVLLWLPEFLRKARGQCRHLQLVDSMGDSELRMEDVEGCEISGQCNVEQMANKDVKISHLRQMRSPEDLENFLSE
jgi:hypothetical protein